MEKSIQGYLGSLRLGEIQKFKNLTMLPVVSDYDDGLGYITLGEALGAGSIEIREVSEGGSVPELRVVNRGGKMVLILDGEELLGAKQNRIVNTTILVDAGCEIVIPVSCVEQGRWTYKSDVGFEKPDPIPVIVQQPLEVPAPTPTDDSGLPLTELLYIVIGAGAWKGQEVARAKYRQRRAS